MTILLLTACGCRRYLQYPRDPGPTILMPMRVSASRGWYGALADTHADAVRTRMFEFSGTGRLAGERALIYREKV